MRYLYWLDMHGRWTVVERQSSENMRLAMSGDYDVCRLVASAELSIDLSPYDVIMTADEDLAPYDVNAVLQLLVNVHQ